MRTDTGRVAIETRYCGATNTKPSRIIATTASGQRHVISYPHHLPSGTDAAHRLAATELADSLGWLADGSQLVSGSTARGYAFVIVRQEVCEESRCSHYGKPKVAVCPSCH